MNIKKVMAKSTPGPVTAIRPNPENKYAENHWEIRAPSPHLQSKYQVVASVNGPWEACNYEANAALLAHWYNAGPKLLQELTEARNLIRAYVEHEEIEMCVFAERELEATDAINQASKVKL